MAKDCGKCGAPYQTGLILCRFCRTAFDEEEARNATPCPRCKDLFPPTTQKCPRCDLWLVVQCVFCSALSPHHHAACDGCGEVFAGAPERKAARDAAGPSWSSFSPAAPAASQPQGSHDFGAWTGQPAETQDTPDLFSSFGKGAEAPKPEPQQGGWSMDDWTSPKRSR